MKTSIRGGVGRLTMAFGVGMVLFLCATAPAQNLFVSILNSNSVDEITSGGTISTFATGITDARLMAFNNAGDLFVQSLSSIIEITPGGTESTFATGLTDIGGLAFNSAGDLFVSDFNVNGSITEITPDGVASTFATGLDEPRGLAFNNVGNLFVGTETNITEITPGGTKSVFAPGLFAVSNLAIDSAGDVFAEDNQSDLTKITPAGAESRFAEGIYQQVAFNGAGNLFVANPTGGDVLEFNSSGTSSIFVSGLGEVEGLAFQPVPEPSILALLAIGMAALLLRRRRP